MDLSAHPVPPGTALLDLDLGAGGLELLPDLVGLRLGNATLDLLGSALDQVLGLLQAEAGDRAQLFDNVDLLSAN